MFKKHSAISSFFYICLAAIMIMFSACENDINEVNALDSKGVNTETAQNIESYLSVGGRTKAKLNAPLMVSTEKDTMKMTFPNTLHVIFYDDSTGLPGTYLFAKHGIYYKLLKKVYLYDSIVGYSIKGDTLRTDELWWDQNTEMIYGSKPTLLKQTNPYGITPGQNGFSAKQDFSEFTFNNVNNGVMEQDSASTGL